MSGVRGDESAERAMSMRVHGAMTAASCRPLIDWSAQDVWAYLALHDLPVCTAYGCTVGGSWDRDRIRVGSLGGDRGTGHGRAEWEQTYYADELAAQHQQ